MILCVCFHRVSCNHGLVTGTKNKNLKDNTKERRKMRRVTVYITKAEILELPHDWMFETHCIHRLREAGIPVIGILVFGGVEHGILTKKDDTITGDIVFTWEDNDVADDKRNSG